MQTDQPQPRGDGPLLRATYALLAIAGLASLARFWRNDIDLWPDVVCQAYLGWRIAMGDALYITLWDSHPPVAALYSALLHLVLSPSVATAKLLVLSTALLFGAAQAFGAWACGLRRPAVLAAIAACMAGLHVQAIANARSEDFVILFGALAVFLAIRQQGVATNAWWAVGAGAAAALGMLAKPGGAAAGIAALVILLGDRRRRRLAAAYVMGGAAVGAAFLLYFLHDGRLAAAYDSVVVYGRIYFRPLTTAVVKEGLHGMASDNSLAFLLVAFSGACAAAASRGRPRIPPWTAAGLGLWLALEAGAALAQTTYYPYVFFPVQGALIGVANVLVSSRMARTAKEDAVVDPTIIGIGTVAIGLAVLWLLRNETVPLHSATLLAGVGAGVAGLVVLGTRALPATRRLPPERLVLLLLLLPCLAVAKHNQSLRHAYFHHYTDRFVALAARLDRFRGETGDTILWFDPAPTIGYLAKMRQAVPEYVSPPLFYDGYAGEAQWQRVNHALPRVNLVLVWKEWLNPLAPEFDLNRYPSYRSAHRQLVTDFDIVASIPVVTGRGPVLVLLRKGTAPGLRAALAASDGAVVAPPS